MKKYIEVLRLDHWIKQLFIFPGLLVALLLTDKNIYYNELILKTFFCVIATCFIASSNYVINEWLDAEFDKYHPIKKYRNAVANNLNSRIIYTIYILLCALGLILGIFVSAEVFYMLLFFLIMGVIYNVKPIRTKDIQFIDVLTESINNVIRFLIGWFIVTTSYFPPVSILIGYWFGGAFLMATKRLVEYRLLGDNAGLYRKSFCVYSERMLLLSSFFYAITSVFFIGIFLIKYRIELILFLPVLIGFFCYYFRLSLKNYSLVENPSVMFKEKSFIIFSICLIVIFTILMVVDIPILRNLTSNDLLLIK